MEFFMFCLFVVVLGIVYIGVKLLYNFIRWMFGWDRG